MKKYIIILIIFSFLFTGCGNELVDIDDEQIETFEVIESNSKVEETKEDRNSEILLSLDEKMSQIDFYLVSGFYSRKVTQDDIELTEMFSLEKNNFIRIESNDLEREVYAYDYVSDDFTYIYYFDGDMISRTIFNIETGAIIEDPDGYVELLQINAQDLKTYFNELLEAGNLDVSDLA